jgi:hypothetical protein
MRRYTQHKTAQNSSGANLDQPLITPSEDGRPLELEQQQQQNDQTEVVRSTTTKPTATTTKTQLNPFQSEARHRSGADHYRSMTQIWSKPKPE